MIGFASGIYFSKFHQSMLKFAEKNLPDDKKVFLICTYGGSANYKSIEQILNGPNVSYPLHPNLPSTLACFLFKICSMDL